MSKIVTLGRPVATLASTYLDFAKLTVLNAPWRLPITFRRDGDSLIAELQLAAGFDLHHFTIDDAERTAALMFKAAIYHTIDWPSPPPE